MCIEKQQKRKVQAVIFNAANAYNLLVEQGIDETVKNPTQKVVDLTDDGRTSTVAIKKIYLF